MNNLIEELELIFVENLQTISALKNQVVINETEKKDQLKSIALEIIDILDSFERIEDYLTKKGFNSHEDSKKIMNRYRTIQKKLLILLQNYGITKIQFPDNRLIVGICEVIETETDNTRKNNEIVSIIKNGYIRGKELIRPALLIVVKN